MASKKIPLTRGKTALVDDASYEFLSQWKWQYSGGYAIRHEYPVGLKGKSVKILMHRQLMGIPAGLMIDHKNRDGLDNRLDNLRIASASENQWNRGIGKNNKSGHKGVVWDRVNKKWRAGVSDKSGYRHIGRFANIHDAVEAREAYIKELHGSFARQV